MRDFGEFTESRAGPSGRRRRSGALAVSLALVFAAALYLLHPGIQQREPELAGGFEGSGEPRAAGGPEAVNVLLMGLDRGRGGSARTDTLMLARLEPDTGEASLLSIPRDLLVEGARPGGGRDRINSAYVSGGAGRTVEVVEDFTGLSVDYYAAADFEGFREIVDALGGVEVEVEGNYLADGGIPAGDQVLSGGEALLYARHRKAPGGDLGRIERQQELLAELWAGVLGWDSVGGIPAVVRALDEHVETDLGTGRMISLGRALAAGPEGGLETYRLEGDPATLDDGREVLVPDEERNERILYEFLG